MTDERLETAVRLRAAGELEESLRLLLALHLRFPDDPVVNYQCAWAHDVLGREREAVPFYVRAIERGLEGEDLCGALLGLGSTYRCIGAYDDAVRTLLRGREEFPAEREFEVFLAMAHYNRGEHAEAMRLLLTVLGQTSESPGVRRYRRAILFYADKLDEVG